MSDFEERLRKLPPAQRAKLLERMRAAKAAKQGAPDDSPLNEYPPLGDHAPLSSAQRQMWYLSQLDAAGRGYEVPYLIRLSGPVDEALLGRSIKQLVRRHIALRTVFPTEAGTPVQRFNEEANDEQWQVLELGASTPEEAVGRILARGFNLEIEPGFRACLLRRSEDERLLVLHFHHIAIDEWGVGIVIDDLDQIYSGTELGAQAIQFPQYAALEAQRLDTESARADLAWWTSELENTPRAVDWPWEDQAGTFAASVTNVEIEIGADVADGLTRRARETGSTVLASYLSVIGTVLARVGGSTSVALGVPATDREGAELQQLVGMLVNTLAVPVDVQPTETISETLARTANRWNEAQRRRRVPLNDVSAALKCSGPPFDVLMNYLPESKPLTTLVGASAEVIPLGLSGTLYPLLVTVHAGNAGHTLSLAYRDAQFDETARDFIAKGFRRGLQRLVEAPSKALTADALWTAHELQQLERSSKLSEHRLRSELAKHLPAALIPAEIVFVDAFPLLPSGKIDRAALSRLASVTEVERVLPRTPLEEAIAATWRSVLERDEIGVDENLFHIGGHSLLAVKLLHKLADATGVTVPLPQLFAHPTVAGLAKWIEEHRDVVADEIRPRTSSDVAPLSAEQLRMWFLQSAAPQSVAYHVPMMMSFGAELDEHALHRAVQAMTRRHEVLRTVYEFRDGTPVQRILPATHEVNFRTVTATDGREAEARLREAVETPFDLTTEPSLRALIVRERDDRAHFLMLFHHIAIDEWSGTVFLEELWAVYEAERTGQPGTFPPPELQYADYAAWQAEQLRSPRLADSLEFWRSSLEGIPAAPAQPACADITGRSSTERSLQFGWSGQLTDTVRKFANLRGTTDFVALLAVFAAFVGRLAQTEDVTIGIPVTQRSNPALQRMIGLLLNTIPLRVQALRSLSFLEVFERVAETWTATMPHHWTPLDEIVRATSASRDSANPLFDQMFVYLADESQVTGEQIEIEAPAKFGLVLAMWPTSEGLAGGWQYDASKFHPAAISDLRDQFTAFAECVFTAPETTLGGHLNLPTTAPHSWTKGTDITVPNACWHQLFGEQARRTPERLAIRSSFGDLTYRELDERSNALAHELVTLGVGPERTVGLALERSAEQIVAIIGILKSGGVYVPLDPALPATRLGEMVSDAQIDVFVTDESGERAVRTFPGARLQATEDRRVTAPDVQIHGENLAYILFTSGTTGRPKGVMCTQHALANLAVTYVAETFAMCESDVQAVKSSATFDMFVAELFPTLSCGAAVAVIEAGTELDPPRFINQLRHSGTTILQGTPTFLQMLTETTDVSIPTMRLVISGGEAVTAAAGTHFEKSFGAKVSNGYGPTEMCVGQAFFAVDPDLQGVLPVGMPTPNHRVDVVADLTERQPVGFDGEILIEGPGEARGYRGMPRRTALAFVPSTLSSRRGARMYRTGDIGRWTQGGAVGYRGRMDHQLQVRGVRVELGEIEARLEDFPGVGRAAVVPMNLSAGRADSLAAYVVLEGDSVFSPTAAQKFLHESLAAAVVPSRFTVLSQMPLMPSGKVDRHKLPEPKDEATNDAPATEMERLVADVWCEVLGLDHVGRFQDFFQVGGHSLAAIRVAHELGSRTDRHLELATLLTRPTVEALAKFLEGPVSVVEDGIVVPLQNGPADHTLILVHPIGGTVFCYRDLVAALDKPCRVLALQAQGTGADAEVIDDMDELARRYADELEPLLLNTERLVIAGWSFGGIATLALGAELTRRGLTIDRQVLIDTYLHTSNRPLDEWQLFENFAMDLAFTLGITAEKLSHLEGMSRQSSPTQRLDFLSQVLTANLGDVPVETLGRMFRVYRANVSAMRNFRPRPSSIPTTLFGATDSNSGLSRHGLSEWLGNLEFVSVRGNHYQLISADVVGPIARAIGATLNE